MLILRDSVASRGVIPPTVAAAVAIAMMVVRSDGYDVWYWSLVGYTMNMQIWGIPLRVTESFRQQYGYG